MGELRDRAVAAIGLLAAGIVIEFGVALANAQSITTDQLGAIGWLAYWSGWALIAVGGIWAASIVIRAARKGTIPVGQWIPLSIERSPVSVALRLRLPDRGRKKRLRREIGDLVQAIRTHVEDSPTPLVESFVDHQAATRAMEDAGDDTDRQAIWDRYTAQMAERTERERQELAALFGGRIQHVTEELVQLRLLVAGDVPRLVWQCSSRHWIVDAANTLEARSMRL